MRSPFQEQSNHTRKPPKAILNSLIAFPPNRDTLGGTSYFILRNEGILKKGHIECFHHYIYGCRKHI